MCDRNRFYDYNQRCNDNGVQGFEDPIRKAYKEGYRNGYRAGFNESRCDKCCSRNYPFSNNRPY